MVKITSCLKIYILFVTSLPPPFPRPPKGMGEENDPRGRVKDSARAGYRHFRCHNVTSGREKRRKPARICDYDVISGL